MNKRRVYLIFNYVVRRILCYLTQDEDIAFLLKGLRGPYRKSVSFSQAKETVPESILGNRSRIDSQRRPSLSQVLARGWCSAFYPT